MSEGNYLQIKVPGYDYSVVHVEMTDDLGADVAKLIGAALELQAGLADAFAPPANEPVDDHPNAPRAPQQNGRSAPSPSGFNGVVFYCPEHNADLFPSVKNPNKDWDDDLQMEVPASWYHQMPGGKSHSVWRSKAAIRQTAAAR